MEAIDLIIKIAAFVAALTTCFVFMRQIFKAVKWIEAIAKQGTENRLSILRLTIVSTEMPLSERIAAGDKYIKLGGNGAVKHLYKSLVDENAKDEKI